MADFDVMNSPDFGAGGGQRALDQSMLASIKALHDAASIEHLQSQTGMAPAELELKKAHTRYYDAETVAKLAGTKQQELMQQIAQSVNGSMPAADPLRKAEAISSRLIDAGLLKPGLDAFKSVAQTRASQEAAETNVARQSIIEARTKRLKLEEFASLANSAVDQQTYAQMLQSLEAQGEDTQRLPPDYTSFAKGPKQQLISQGTRVIDQLRLKEEQLRNQTRERAVNSRVARDRAAIGVLNATERLKTRELDDQEKHLGKYDPSVVAGRRALTQLREVKREKELRALAPPAPAKPTDTDIGKTFRNPSGVIGTWTKGGWVIGGPGTAALGGGKISSSTSGALADDSGDDEEDD